jgi:uncharacterized repeat protein (TIGR03806 family)
MNLVSLNFACVLAALTVAGCGGGSQGDSQGGNQGGNSAVASVAAYGLDQRLSAAGLNIPTSAARNGLLTAVNAFPNLAFGSPTVITHAGDGSNRLFVAERAGEILVFDNNAGVTASQVTTLLDLSPRVDSDAGEAGLLGMVFDPAFETNRRFYVAYVTQAAPRRLRIARFLVSADNANVADPNSEVVLLDIGHPAEAHFGGWIGFGPDGMLYISTGDGKDDSAPQDTAKLLGKVLRIQVNADGTYASPPDNPFGNEVWARGFRNPWRCSFDRAKTTVDDNLWCGDVGEASREEVNRIKRGANYGWPIYEGSLPYKNPGNLPYASFEPALYEYDHTVGTSVIGGYVYRGSALPGVAGRYLYTDPGTLNMWAISLDTEGNFAGNTLVAGNLQQVQTFGEDEAGELYGASATGMGIQRFVSNGAVVEPKNMPGTLSATGLFTNLATLTPAPALIDYEINSPLWSDGARKRRWLVLPDSQAVGFAANEPWNFPVGTITVKHFELPLASGGTTRVETRVMVNRADGWIGYTYRWRADGSDADLLINGASAAYDSVDPATGAAARVNWTFPSQTQCLQCHTQATGRVLGLNAAQLNRSHTYQRTGIADNQLRTLNHVGVFAADIGSPSQYGALPSPSDTGATLESRAKAYLEANCSVCHRPGGPTPINMDLRYSTSLADMNILGVTAASPTEPGAARVVAGDHAGSDLWRRASSTGATRMPPLGVSVIDEEGLKLLADWIDSIR